MNAANYIKSRKRGRYSQSLNEGEPNIAPNSFGIHLGEFIWGTGTKLLTDLKRGNLGGNLGGQVPKICFHLTPASFASLAVSAGISGQISGTVYELLGDLKLGVKLGGQVPKFSPKFLVPVFRVSLTKASSNSVPKPLLKALDRFEVISSLQIRTVHVLTTLVGRDQG